jgi:hypothetical protein
MLAVNRSVHLECNVHTQGLSINRLLVGLREAWRQNWSGAAQRLLLVIQEEHL